MTDKKQNDTQDWSRRDFMKTTAAAAGAGMVMGLPVFGQDAPAPASADELAVAIIGPGSQGRNLLLQCLKIPDIRFVALADIWEYHQRYARNILKKYDQLVNVYDDYQVMLEKEPQIDAVIIATPDWVHSEQTVACLQAGKHVYCEKEMSNTVEGARAMVRAARDTGKLLQIGHQRRSEPRYWHAIKLIEKDKVLGRITSCYGQWNKLEPLERSTPKKTAMTPELLAKHGYGSMDQLRNWRWYRKFSGGAMADLGSHQIDVFNWVLKARPRSVMASGGLDFYTDKGWEWYDHVMAIYEYATEAGPVRGFYQVLSTTSHGGFYETFMGKDGSMEISEDPRKGQLFREVTAKRREWEDESEIVQSMGRDAIELKIGETLAPDGTKDPEGQRLLAESKKPGHQLHLENFFNAIRTGSPLSCPSEVGFETAVSVLKANEAVEAERRIEFTDEDFAV